MQVGALLQLSSGEFEAVEDKWLSVEQGKFNPYVRVSTWRAVPH